MNKIRNAENNFLFKQNFNGMHILKNQHMQYKAPAGLQVRGIIRMISPECLVGW